MEKQKRRVNLKQIADNLYFDYGDSDTLPISLLGGTFLMRQWSLNALYCNTTAQLNEQ